MGAGQGEGCVYLARTQVGQGGNIVIQFVGGWVLGHQTNDKYRFTLLNWAHLFILTKLREEVMRDGR